MRPLLVALAAVLLLSGCGASPLARTGLPDVTLPGAAGGKAVDLGSFKGPALVNVWASYCAPCKRELPIYEQFSRQQRGKVAVLGIDYEDMRRDKAQQLLRRSAVTYPNVLDDDGRTRTRFLPRLLLVDAHGRVVHDEYLEITSLAQLRRLVGRYLKVSA